ncbi:MAG: diguanylate cyclase (GGDEF)-like protein [bacterium]|jgi:diguanylate cyclase (GGDEF)-like protein
MSLQPGRLTDLIQKPDGLPDFVVLPNNLGSLAESISSVLTSAQTVWQSAPLPIIAATATSIIAIMVLTASLQKRKTATTTMQKTLDAMPDAIALFDKSGKLTALNQKLVQLMPLKIEPEAFSKTDTNNLYAQISPDSIAVERARKRAREAASDPNSTISFEAPSYGLRSMLVKERRTRDGGVSVSVYGSTNPTQNRLSDPLTALASRTRLVHELAKRCSRTKNELSLIIVDLRSFRQINDTYGREAGDELLKQTANCLLHIMPKDSLIARTAGDEFAVLLESDLGRPAIEKLLQGLLRTLRSGLPVSDMNVPVRASVGIAYAPEHGNTVSSLLKSADSACAQAKQGTDNALVVFNSAQQRQAKRRHQLEIGLQQALGKNELSLQYQPQIDIRSKMTCGMEALLRWESAKFGKVSPVDFIPVAEETGIINQLGTWVLNQAVKDYQRLACYGMSPAILSVNLSRKQFEGGRIVADVERLLSRTNFDPAKLCLEITETSLSSDSKKLREQLLDLTSLGVRLAIDDFGVGYSSLLELRDYPISEVKIDRAFIMDIATNTNSQDFVHAIVDISRSIGAEVVAEGIENQQQFDMVDQLGCDRAQGYFLCEPMAATTFPDVVLGA